MVAIMLAMLVPLTADTASAADEVWRDDFNTLSGDWTIGKGTWTISSGNLYNGASRSGNYIYLPVNLDGAFEFEVRLKTQKYGNYLSSSTAWYFGLLDRAENPFQPTGTNYRSGWYSYGDYSWGFNTNDGSGGGAGFTGSAVYYTHHIDRFKDGSTWKVRYWVTDDAGTKMVDQTITLGSSVTTMRYIAFGTQTGNTCDSSVRSYVDHVKYTIPWDDLTFTSKPSVANIIKTVDGRTVTASTVATNYTSIVWDMGDNTTYTGVTQVRHTYADNGTYTVTVTAYDWLGQEASTSTAVQIGENETASVSIDLPWIIFAIAAVVTGLLFLLTRDPRALIGVVLAGAAMIAMVML